MWCGQRALCAFAALQLALAQPPSGYAAISTSTVCRSDAALNVIPGLPRLNVAAKATSSDLGAYHIFTCSGTGTGRSCDVYTGFKDALTSGSVYASLKSDAVTGTLVEYAEGLFWYSGLNIVIALAIIIGTTLFIIGRYMCCCCCRPAACTCLRCGAAYPTRKAPLCGYTDLKSGAVGYPAWERLATLLLMVAFVVFAGSLIIVGVVKGDYGLTTGMAKTASAGDGIAGVVHAAVGPAMQLFVSVASTTLLPMVLSLNATIQGAVDVHATADALTCVNATLATLPNATYALALLAQLQTGTAALRGAVGELSADLAVLGPQRDAVAALSAALSADVTAFNAGGVTAALANASAVVASAGALKAQLAAPGTGLAVTAGADLALLRRNDAAPPGGAYPSVANFTAAAGVGAEPGTVLRLYAGSMDGNATEAGMLVGRLAYLYAALAPGGPLPNYTATAAALSNVSSLVAAAQGSGALIANLRGAVGTLQALVAGAPSPGVVQAQATALLSAANGVALGSLLTHLGDLSAALALLPSFPALLTEVDRVRTAATVLPCLQTLSAQLQAVNASLVTLPDGAGELATLFASVNATIMNAMANVNSTEATLTFAEASVAAVNVSLYEDQATTAQAALTSQIGAFNFAAFNATLASVNASVTNFNFSGISGSINALESALAAVNTTTLSAAASVLAAFEATREALQAQLSTAVAPSLPGINPAGDYRLFAQSYCTGNSQYYCVTSPDCVVASIDFGPCAAAAATRRCSSGAQTVSCSFDADCPVTAHCLADTTRATALRNALVAAEAALPDVSGPGGQLATLLAFAAAANVAGASASIAAAQAAVGTFTPAAYTATLTQLSSAAAGVDIAGANAKLASANETLASVPAGAFTGDVSSLVGTVQDLQDNKRPLVVKATGLVVALVGYLDNQLPVYATTMSAPALNAALAAGGPSAMITSVTDGVIDATVSYFATAQTAVAVPSFNLTPSLSSYLPYLDRAAATAGGPYADLYAHGGAYYLASLAAPDSVLPASAGGTLYVTTDASGQTYAGGKLCVTTECITATTNHLNSAAASDIGAALPGGVKISPGGRSIPISREQLFFIPWIGPIIIVLLAAFALAAPLLCRAPRWQKCPAAWVAGCIICQAPCIFLGTALTFPMVIVGGDMCASGFNIADNYMVAYGDSLCAVAQGTSGGLDACVYTTNQTIASADVFVNVTASLHGMARGMLGACPAPDPIAALLDDGARQLAPVPHTIAASYLNSGIDALGSSGVTLSPAVRAIVLNATTTLGDAFAAFVRGEAGTAFSCGSLSAALAGVKDVLCCDVLPPVYWGVAAWYLVAWAMCCCGLPAACLGRKRLPTQPWGPVYEAELAAVDAVLAADEGRYGRPPAPRGAAVVDYAAAGAAGGGAGGRAPSSAPPVVPAHDLLLSEPPGGAPGAYAADPRRRSAVPVPVPPLAAATPVRAPQLQNSPGVDGGVFTGENRYAGANALAFPPRGAGANANAYGGGDGYGGAGEPPSAPPVAAGGGGRSGGKYATLPPGGLGGRGGGGGGGGMARSPSMRRASAGSPAVAAGPPPSAAAYLSRGGAAEVASADLDPKR